MGNKYFFREFASVIFRIFLVGSVLALAMLNGSG